MGKNSFPKRPSNFFFYVSFTCDIQSLYLIVHYTIHFMSKLLDKGVVATYIYQSLHYANDLFEIEFAFALCISLIHLLILIPLVHVWPLSVCGVRLHLQVIPITVLSSLPFPPHLQLRPPFSSPACPLTSLLRPPVLRPK